MGMTKSMPTEFLQSWIASQPDVVRQSFVNKPNGRVAKLVIKDANRAWRKSTRKTSKP